MKFLATSVAVLAITSTALASPPSFRNGRSVRHPGSGLSHRKSTSIVESTAAQAYSNPARAVIVSKDVTKVSCTFTVPKPKVPRGGDPGAEYYSVAWLVLIVTPASFGLVQTGVFWCVQDRTHSYQAWYEWIP